MHVKEADKLLKQQLKDAGVNTKTPQTKAVWEVFKRFAEIPVEGAERDEDMLFFQCGLYTFTGRPLFYFDFVRQFAIPHSEAEDDHLEQLHCELTFEPHDELNILKTSLWSNESEAPSAFFERVQGLREFQSVVAKHLPLELKVYQERTD